MSTPEKTFDAVIAGHVCLDIIPHFQHVQTTSLDEILVPGKLVNIGEVALSTGGAVSNTGLAMLRLGMKTSLMAKIGQDLFGTGIQAKFQEYDADAKTSMIMVPEENTSYTIVLAPPGVDRIFLHNPGANNTFCSRDINYELVAQSRLFHLGYPPLMKTMFADNARELIAVYRRVQDLGVTTSMDMSLPDPQSESGRVNWRHVLEAVLPTVDIAPFSAEEAMYMLDRRRFDDLKQQAGSAAPLDAYTSDDFLWLGRTLVDLGVAIALVKCGERGLLLATAGVDRVKAMGAATPQSPKTWSSRVLWEEAFLVDKVVSTTGAGDNTVAGFLAAFLRGCEPIQSLKTASCVGAQNVQVLDAVSGVHTWEETQAMMHNWPKRRHLAGVDWHYDEHGRVWRHAGDSDASHRAP